MCYTFGDRGWRKGVVRGRNKRFQSATEQAGSASSRTSSSGVCASRIRLFGCRWCGGAERISAEILGAQQHHRGSQRDIIPRPAEATHLPSLWKCNCLLFWKILRIGVEDFFNGLVCKLMRTGGIQFCNVQNFSCALFKIDFNFAPLAVVVCLVFVDCGGDFLFSADDLLLFLRSPLLWRCLPPAISSGDPQPCGMLSPHHSLW